MRFRHIDILDVKSVSFKYAVSALFACNLVSILLRSYLSVCFKQWVINESFQVVNTICPIHFLIGLFEF
jgi:hypothetical protein